MTEAVVSPDRRDRPRTDRRKMSRNGRRASDPRVNWRKIAWLFAGYGLFMSIRSLPSTIRKLFKRQTPTPTA